MSCENHKKDLFCEPDNNFSKMIDELKATRCFKIEVYGYEITFIKNDMMQGKYAILSPELYEKLHQHFSQISKPMKEEKK